MKRSCLLLGVFLSGWSVLAFPAFVGNWSFLTQSGPYDVFNREDFEIFKTSANEVLDKGKDGETIPWENPKSAAQGTQRIIRSFSRDSQKCRRLEMFSRLGNRQSRITFNFCLQPDDTWSMSH